MCHNAQEIRYDTSKTMFTIAIIPICLSCTIHVSLNKPALFSITARPQHYRAVPHGHSFTVRYRTDTVLPCGTAQTHYYRAVPQRDIITVRYRTATT